MTDVALPIRPFAFHAEAEPPRLVLIFDDTDENRRFGRLVFEAALAGEPMALRPALEAEHRLLLERVAAAELARTDALARVDAAEARERAAREQLADAERELVKLHAERDASWRSGSQRRQAAAGGRRH